MQSAAWQSNSPHERPTVLGLLTSYTLGVLLHLLLVSAVIAILLRLISGRRV